MQQKKTKQDTKEKKKREHNTKEVNNSNRNEIGDSLYKVNEVTKMDRKTNQEGTQTYKELHKSTVT